MTKKLTNKKKESKHDKILIKLLQKEFHIEREYAKYVVNEYNEKKNKLN